MSTKTGRTLMWFSIVVLATGSAVGAPAASVLLMVLAALSAMAPIVVGPKGPRIVGAVVLAASFAVALAHLPEAGRQMDLYRERSLKTKNHVPPGPAQTR